MTNNVESMSNRALADTIEKRNAWRDKTTSPIWDAAAHRDERWLEIIMHLGEADSRVKSYRKADEAIEEAYDEARRRCGPASFRALYATMLRGMKGRRRAA